MAHFRFDPADLVPSDRRAAAFDPAQVTVDRVDSADDPLFEQAYARLWEQFGEADEMETREVLGRRLKWDPAQPHDGFAMRYDLLLARDRAGNFAAVRDHAAIADARGVLVQLSHLLVAPAWRRSGLAAWLRAFPVQTARDCLGEAALSPETSITLAAEMEYPDGKDDSRLVRLKAYERAGFRKIDPASIDYRQPDFRPPDAIDASGGPVPLRFQLLVRRVCGEGEKTISGTEVRDIVQRIYRIYAREFRPQDMAAVWRLLDAYPTGETRIALVAPTA